MCCFEMHGYCTARVADFVAMVRRNSCARRSPGSLFRIGPGQFQQRLEIDVSRRFRELIGRTLASV